MDICTHFSGFVHRSGSSGSYDRCIFNFTRDRQIISQNGCTISHSYQQGIKVPVATDPDQCLGLLVFVPISILGYCVSLWL